MRVFQNPKSGKVSTSGQYLLAFAATVVCTCISAAIRPLSSEAPFLLFLPAVIYSLWIGGFRVSLFASVLSALSVDFFLLPPLYSFYAKPQDLAKELFFLAIMGITAWLFQVQRERSERSLRLQRNLLETAVESILVTDAQHHIIYWNAGAERLYGWAETEAVGKDPLELLETTYPVSRQEIDRQLMETGRWHGQLHRKSKNGQNLITETSWALDQQTGYILQTSLNITAQSLAEQSIRLQGTLLENAVESILIADAQHHIIYWNKGAERVYGWSEAEAIGKDAQELLHTACVESREEIDRQLRQSGRWQGRFIRKNKDGHSVIIEASLAMDSETGYILQTSLDVTDKDFAESELRRVNRALSALSRVNQLLIHAQTEDHLLQQAVEIIAEEGGYPLVWIAIPNDDPGRTVSVGASAGKAVDYLSILNLSWKDEPIGRGPTGTALREGRVSVNHDFLTYPDCAPWREAAMQYGFRSSICLPLIGQGKTIAGITLYASEESAFEDKELALVSELAGDLSYALDALRMRQQAEEERKSRTLLEEQLAQSQKIEAIGRLAGGISHDFNNLLMVIMAQTELLSLRLTGDDLVRAENIMSSAQRAAELTRQLLAFSRKQIVELKSVSLNPILAEIAKMAAHLVGEDVEIAVNLGNELWPVMVDRSQIEQVIMNLVVNARDAMPDGGKLTLETLNVNLTTEYNATHPLVPPGRYVMMAVSDTGVGIDEAIQARMFEPFFTTKESGKGTGLGLAMVYGIVKQSNGFIWFYSEVGKGTCFKVYLPASDVPAAAEELPATAAAPAPESATILLVEDEADLREIISEFLISAGHTVIAAQSHEEALERATEFGSSIDLLLTDVILRGRNGKQLADSLLAKGFNFKVTYMSGYTPNAIVHHGVLEEGTSFLQKPFSRTALLAKIQEALDR